MAEDHKQRGALSLIVTALRKRSLSSKDLQKETKIPERTMFRVLDELKAAGLIVDIDGRHFWYENAATKVFSNESEKKHALDHSRFLVSGLKSVFREFPFVDMIYRDLQPRIEYEKNWLAHMNSGYPLLSQDYERLMRTKEEINKEENKFIEDIVKKLSINNINTSSPEDLGKIILYDIREVLRGHDPSYLINLKVNSEYAESNPFRLGPREMFETLKSFITSEEKSDENVRSCRKIIAQENSYYDLRIRLETDLTELMKKVENGVPLGGRCIICLPEIKTDGAR